jgi:hypothetical protein
MPIPARSSPSVDKFFPVNCLDMAQRHHRRRISRILGAQSQSYRQAISATTPANLGRSERISSKDNRPFNKAYWFGTKRVELGPILALGVVCDEYPSSYQGSIVLVQRNVTQPKVEERILAAEPATPPTVLSRLSQRSAPSSKTNPEHIVPVTQTTRYRNRVFMASGLIQRTPLRLLFDGFRGWKYHAKSIFQAPKRPAFRSRCPSRTYDPSSKVRAVTQGPSLLQHCNVTCVNWGPN